MAKDLMKTMLSAIFILKDHPSRSHADISRWEHCFCPWLQGTSSSPHPTHCQFCLTHTTSTPNTPHHTPNPISNPHLALPAHPSLTFLSDTSLVISLFSLTFYCILTLHLHPIHITHLLGRINTGWQQGHQFGNLFVLAHILEVILGLDQRCQRIVSSCKQMLKTMSF